MWWEGHIDSGSYCEVAGREIYIINIQERRKAKKGGGPQIKLMPLKILTAEKAINHYAQNKMTTSCNLSYLCMAEKICAAKNKTVRCHFIFARNQVIMICQNLMPFLEKECFF